MKKEKLEADTLNDLWKKMNEALILYSAWYAVRFDPIKKVDNKFSVEYTRAE